MILGTSPTQHSHLNPSLVKLAVDLNDQRRRMPLQEDGPAIVTSFPEKPILEATGMSQTYSTESSPLKPSNTWKFNSKSTDKKRSRPSLFSNTFKSKSPKRSFQDYPKSNAGIPVATINIDREVKEASKDVPRANVFKQSAVTFTSSLTAFTNSSTPLNLPSTTLNKQYNRIPFTERGKIILELLDSEIRYEKSLLTIQKIYYTPLSKSNPRILDKKAMNDVFSNLFDIILFSGRLKQDLYQRISDPGFDVNEEGCIGDILINLAPFMKVYTFYVLRFKTTLESIKVLTATNGAFQAFLKKANSKPECAGLGLQAFLLMPVQRIPRYRLLIENLMLHTTESHKDYGPLKKSLDMVQNIVNLMNEQVREYEMYNEIVGIQKSIIRLDQTLLTPGRKLIKKGLLQKVCRKNHQVRQVFLFSDCLIYCSPSFIDGQFVFHRKIDLDLCTIKPSEGFPAIRFAFQLKSPVKSFVLYAESQDECNRWIESFQTAIERLKSSKREQIIKSEDQENQFFKDRMRQAYTAPIWVPDDNASRCMVCDMSFTMFRRKHHCRMCGKVICYYCSSKSFVVPGIEEDRVVRSCDVCIKSISVEGKLEVVDTCSTAASSLMSCSARTSLESTGSMQTGNSFSVDVFQSLPANNSKTAPVYRRRVYETSRPLSVLPTPLWGHFHSLNIATEASNPRHSIRGAALKSVGPPRSSFDGFRRFSVDNYVRECTLCQEPFSLTKWRYPCCSCKRIACLDCLSTPKTVKTEYSAMMCDACVKGVPPEKVVLYGPGLGWGCKCDS